METLIRSFTCVYMFEVWEWDDNIEMKMPIGSIGNFYIVNDTKLIWISLIKIHEYFWKLNIEVYSPKILLFIYKNLTIGKTINSLGAT